jgi:hypothetical protein
MKKEVTKGKLKHCGSLEQFMGSSDDEAWK